MLASPPAAFCTSFNWHRGSERRKTSWTVLRNRNQKGSMHHEDAAQRNVRSQSHLSWSTCVCIWSRYVGHARPPGPARVWDGGRDLGRSTAVGKATWRTTDKDVRSNPRRGLKLPVCAPVSWWAVGIALSTGLPGVPVSLPVAPVWTGCLAHCWKWKKRHEKTRNNWNECQGYFSSS